MVPDEAEIHIAGRRRGRHLWGLLFSLFFLCLLLAHHSPSFLCCRYTFSHPSRFLCLWCLGAVDCDARRSIKTARSGIAGEQDCIPSYTNIDLPFFRQRIEMNDDWMNENSVRHECLYVNIDY